MLSLFPRGENIVTRMPIRLHLVHFPNRLAVVDFCAEFEHDVMGEPLDVDEDGFYLRCAVSKRGTPSLLIEVRCVATRLGVGPRPPPPAKKAPPNKPGPLPDFAVDPV